VFVLDLRVRPIKYLIIHHTAGNEANTQVIRNYHVNVNGWGDIGYHGVVERSGVIGVGRDVKYIGAHSLGRAPGETLNMNHLGYGLSCIGNFETGIMSPIQFDALVKEACRICKLYNIPFENIRRHSDDDSTSCPGKLFPWMNFLTEVNKVMKAVVSSDVDVYLSVRVRTSKKNMVIKQIIDMGYACKELSLA